MNRLIRLFYIRMLFAEWMVLANNNKYTGQILPLFLRISLSSRRGPPVGRVIRNTTNT